MKQLIILISIVFSISCSTPAKDAIQEIRKGMTKSDVLELAGNPRFSWRLSGQDIWTFSYFEGEQEYRRQVTFRDGLVTELSPFKLHPQETTDLDRAETLEQYEAAIRKVQKSQKKPQFEEIKGGD